MNEFVREKRYKILIKEKTNGNQSNFTRRKSYRI
jgi:hypothetical protein